MARRVILHADMNNFYASVECLYNPAIRGFPVAVCGDPDARHGIVLAKNYLAKHQGVITGQAIWQAKQTCPSLVVVRPDYRKYLRFAKLARAMYAQYTDQIEPFGLDEAWLDVTGSVAMQGNGQSIADELRLRIRDELGITASIGVADNKIFAKLGSDMKKPDATTVITQGNYRDKVWPLPVEELLYVGRATRRKLSCWNIKTIGDLARCDLALLQKNLGKWGHTLWSFANGLDVSPVMQQDESSLIKSIGNSTTTPRDLTCFEDVKVVFSMLCESVASRLREHDFVCRTLQIYVRDKHLACFERQGKLPRPTQLADDLCNSSLHLFAQSYDWQSPIRSLGVRATDLDGLHTPLQLDFLPDARKQARSLQLAQSVDDIRRRFGHFSIQRALMLTDRPLTKISPKDDHIIHPVSFF